MKKVITYASAAIVLALGIFIYFRFHFVFGEGVKAGELNQFIYKGWIWKTYEGRLIMTGFSGGKSTATIQSNEFNFSVTDKAVADSLQKCSGKIVQLHYREYKGRLPWRGMQNKIVDKILSVEASSMGGSLPSDLPITGE